MLKSNFIKYLNIIKYYIKSKSNQLNQSNQINLNLIEFISHMSISHFLKQKISKKS